MLTTDLRVRPGEERCDPEARRAALGSDDGRQPVERRRELVVGGAPVADRRLEAVVELEHVERPRAGEREVGAEVGLRHRVEVVVPGAPADLVRRRGARVPGPTERGGPVLQERRRVALPFVDGHTVELAALARLQHRPAEERFDPELDGIGVPRGRGARGTCRRAPIPRGTPRPAPRRCRRAEPSRARCAAHRPRPAPSRRGASRSGATGRRRGASGPRRRGTWPPRWATTTGSRGAGRAGARAPARAGRRPPRHRPPPARPTRLATAQVSPSADERPLHLDGVRRGRPHLDPSLPQSHGPAP